MVASPGGSETSATTPPPLVAVVGDAALDLSFSVVSLDDGVDEKLAVTDSHRELGGTGANAATAIQRLGGRARLHTAVGSDSIGRELVQQIVERGIDAAGVSVVDGRSTVAVILRDPRRRLVVVDRGVADDVTGLDPTTITQDAALVYVSSIAWALAARVLTSSRVPVVIGVEARQTPELAAVGTPEATAETLDRARVVVTNEAGANAFARIFQDLATAAVVVTRGAAGAKLIIPGRPPVVVAAPAVDVVDATGAGDCFSGALCRFLAGTSPLEHAVRLATIAASMSTRQVGAQAGIPTQSEVLTMFADLTG